MPGARPQPFASCTGMGSIIDIEIKCHAAGFRFCQG